MDNKKECTICLEQAELISPGKQYKCRHEVCRNCWKNIAINNPVCPFCRADLALWMMRDMKFKVQYYIGEVEEPDWHDITNQVDINELNGVNYPDSPDFTDLPVENHRSFTTIIEIHPELLNDENRDMALSRVLQYIFDEESIDEPEIPVTTEEIIDDMFTYIGDGRVQCKCGATCAKTYMDKHKESKEHRTYIGEIKYEVGEVWRDDGKFHCHCGSVINPVGIKTHFKTRKHLEFMERRNKN